MKLKDIFPKDNMYSLGVGVVAVGVTAAVGAIAAGVGVGAAAIGTVVGVGVVAIAFPAAFVVAVVEGKFGLKLNISLSFVGAAMATGIVAALAAISSNAPQTGQELSAVFESAAVQAESDGARITIHDFSFSGEVRQKLEAAHADARQAFREAIDKRQVEREVASLLRAGDVQSLQARADARSFAL